MAKTTQKYFRENFDGAETANIQPSESFLIYGILYTLGSTNTDGQWLLLMCKKLTKSDQKVTNAVQSIVVHAMVIGFMILQISSEAVAACIMTHIVYSIHSQTTKTQTNVYITSTLFTQLVQ